MIWINYAAPAPHRASNSPENHDWINYAASAPPCANNSPENDDLDLLRRPRPPSRQQLARRRRLIPNLPRRRLIPGRHPQQPPRHHPRKIDPIQQSRLRQIKIKLRPHQLQLRRRKLNPPITPDHPLQSLVRNAHKKTPNPITPNYTPPNPANPATASVSQPRPKHKPQPPYNPPIPLTHHINPTPNHPKIPSPSGGGLGWGRPPDPHSPQPRRHSSRPRGIHPNPTAFILSLSKDECRQSPPPTLAPPAPVCYTPPQLTPNPTPNRSARKNDNSHPRPETRGGGGGGDRNPAAAAIALKTLTALTLLAAVAALILYVYSAAIPAGASAHWTDYDTDDDGLIEIDTIAELQGIRYDHDGNGWIAPGFRSSDLAPYNAAFPNRQTSSVDTLAATTTRMGCPAACIGYELMDDLDFADATTTQRNWTPNYNYNGIFEGNGYTISNMNISLNSPAGLFPGLEGNAIVRNVGLINPTVSGRNAVGALASVNNGIIIASYASGGSITYGTANNSGTVGGLVGTNQGTIIASYSTATATKAGSITSSGVYRGGGLVGWNTNTGTIIASYAAGSVSHSATGGTIQVGGLVGQVDGASSTITHSYCDTTVQATTTPCIGAWASGASTTTAAAAGYTTAELQTPTGYTGIFANWNVDLNDDTFPDNPWYFGTSTSSPVITDPKTTDPPAANQRTIDYDSDNDNLINVDTLQKLNAIRHDLNGDGNPANIAAYAAAFPGGHLADTSTPYMGCESTCEGYELTANLDFAADGAAVTSTDAYPNWTPIGGSYAAEFNGNGHTISRLTIDSTSTLRGGLFNTLANRGVIRDVGMIDPSVSVGGLYAGALAAFIDTGGEISASYVQGGSVVGTALSFLGGLTGNNSGTIRASYSSASVDAGSVSGSGVGGLVGSLSDDGTIIASYAAGPVSGSGATLGGFVATVQGAGSAITDSYCDTGAAGQANCIGTQPGAAVSAAGHSSTTLQTPVAYTGIYANWNVSVDGDAFPDNPWNFGSTTTYPALKTPTQRQAAQVMDYDSDNDNLIDIDSPHKLNAIRHDLNGDGLPDAVGNYPAYAGAFPDGDLATTTPNAPRMGCPATCIGYELTGNINFAADGIAVTGTDPYPNWTPIGGSYAATFDGKGNTINHLTIAGATGNSGLFNTLGSGGVIRDVGMVDASIGNDGADAYVGVLAGDNDGGMIITSYASGGAVTVTGTSTYGGGLLGRNAGDLRAVYSTAAVNASSTATSTAASPTVGGLIGLHTGSVTASYAAGTTTGSAAAIVGGFAGAASSTAAAITASYCDTTVNGTSTPCVAAHTNGATATSTGYTTTQLQTPTGYTGIYEAWNIRLGADNMLDDPWNFGGATATTRPSSP